MKHVTEHTGKLEVIERCASSVNGNPRYLLRVDGVTCRTGVDSMHGYGITNDEGKTIKAEIGLHYGTVTLRNYEVVK